MKLLLVCNPGGHFSTMMSLKKFWSAHEREWVTYNHFDTERLHGQEAVHWVLKQEAREFWRAAINCIHAVQIVRKSRPDMILSTGAGLAVPFLVIGKLFGIKTIFIESLSRSYELSLSGRLVYNLVDELYVQWPQCIERNPRAQYRGVVL